LSYYIVQIPPRNPETDVWRLHEVPYRERRHAIAAVEAHRTYGFHDADYIEVTTGEYEDENF
jgi:hypothetical protein